MSRGIKNTAEKTMVDGKPETHRAVRLALDAPLGAPPAKPLGHPLLVYKVGGGSGETHLVKRGGKMTECGDKPVGQTAIGTGRDPSCAFCKAAWIRRQGGEP